MTGTVTKWIRQLEKGDPAAAQSLFDHFFDDLVRRCRARLAGKPPRATDGEDVAVQALASFFRKATDKDFPQLDDRHDLWKLLLAIAGNKAKSLLRDENRQKRGGGRVVGENVLSGGNSIEGWNLDWEMGNVETPEMKA